MQKKKQFIRDFQKDDIVNDLFVVKFKKPVEQYKNGYKFELRLGDSSKEIMYKYWGSADEAKVTSLYNSINKDDVVLVQGRVNEWNGLEISANDQHTIRVLHKGEYDVLDFIKKSTKDPIQMWNEFIGYIDSIQNPEIKKLVKHFFDNQEFAEKFKFSPAAMYIHHGWIHGLLEHTLEVMKICDFVCKLTPSLDRDLVMAGAILHDMGKLEEFNVTTNISVTTEGMLVGHVTIAVEKLSKAFDQLNTPKELRMKMIHMILTHMGEYGSNKTPAFPEALLLYNIDRLSGDLTNMMTLKQEANTEDDYIYNKNFGNVYLK